MKKLTKMDYGLRFIDTSEKSLLLIKSTFKLKPDSVRSYYKNPKNYVIVYKKLKTFKVEVLANLIANIDAKKIDIYIGMMPRTDSDIIDVPEYVTRLLSIPGLKLTLSYTII